MDKLLDGQSPQANDRSLCARLPAEGRKEWNSHIIHIIQDIIASAFESQLWTIDFEVVMASGKSIMPQQLCGSFYMYSGTVNSGIPPDEANKQEKQAHDVPVSAGTTCSICRSCSCRSCCRNCTGTSSTRETLPNGLLSFCLPLRMRSSCVVRLTRIDTCI